MRLLQKANHADSALASDVTMAFRNKAGRVAGDCQRTLISDLADSPMAVTKVFIKMEATFFLTDPLRGVIH